MKSPYTYSKYRKNSDFCKLVKRSGTRPGPENLMDVVRNIPSNIKKNAPYLAAAIAAVGGADVLQNIMQNYDAVNFANVPEYHNMLSTGLDLLKVIVGVDASTRITANMSIEEFANRVKDDFKKDFNSYKTGKNSCLIFNPVKL